MVLLLIAGAFGLLLLTAALTVAPARALPRQLSAAVDGRRELLLFIALCFLSCGLVVALLAAVMGS